MSSVPAQTDLAICTQSGKWCYPTRKLAVRWANRIAASNRHRTPRNPKGVPKAYQCHHCHHWHLTSGGLR